MGWVLVLSTHWEEMNAGGLSCWSQEKPQKLPAAGVDQHQCASHAEPGEEKCFHHLYFMREGVNCTDGKDRHWRDNLIRKELCFSKICSQGQRFSLKQQFLPQRLHCLL